MYQLHKTKIDGCLELTPNIFNDHRGISIKPFHSDFFQTLGVEHNFNEDLMVISHKGVLRGMHLQNPPLQQAKLIYCASGSIFDVAVDVRKNSPTYGQHVAFYVDAVKHNIVYIPSGLAHGYLVLEDCTTVIYKMSSVYSPGLESGFRWDSAAIPWPVQNPILSDKDKSLPGFNDFVSIF
ncbi:MAG TPA: dTDP-4-dehydrorhamnose 3,5-epimerase [Methylomusa anaerophila]|uniref:dTDP-4-dehydrorhamnose 3,5-epimerase n=1 Tax=Methylomusa anaerophila TaxID=1930071 RepID=A0A348AH64_9FIRM|nr:dTDP-4-dehydrorhamnose 3,5-epimerase [Methylomusa anaerophila]BBB90412.1 dTDP-4-dehydrorhamnose 3,5-epimerase [Methylomusa anaerophila]HML90373.1 dTDP-4-dehydrorhamnose 3,5-epimerase [Methylomusa anaerophila]